METPINEITSNKFNSRLPIAFLNKILDFFKYNQRSK